MARVRRAGCERARCPWGLRFFAGTVADAYLFTVLRWSEPVKIDMSRWPNLVAYLARTSTAIELYEAMLSLHPNRVNPGSLWAAAKAFKPS